jgi:steroid delta-isomerase-like uncharacterized protein
VVSTEDNKALARRHMELLDRRALDAAAEEYALSAACRGLAPAPLDVAGYRQAMSALFAAFPDSRFSTDDLIAEGDKVAIRHTFRGTHRGEFQGIPPSGEFVTVAAIAILRVEDGKIAESWLNADFLGLLQQIGALPAPA